MHCYNGNNNNPDKPWVYARCIHLSIGEFLVQSSRKNYSTIPNMYIYLSIYLSYILLRLSLIHEILAYSIKFVKIITFARIIIL